MRTAGIIGGMGPETTARFYLDVIFKCHHKNNKQRPPILLWSVPLLYRIEEDFIRNAEGAENYLPYLIEAAKNLEKGGADFLVMPCNSVHVFINEIRREVEIPVLSILEETEKFVRSLNARRIGLLATKLTINQKLYDKLLLQEIDIVKPGKSDQARLGRIISKIVVSKNADREKAQLIKIIWNLARKGADTIILGCTDLQLLTKPKEIPIPVHDTMDLLVDATVREILGTLNNP